MGRQPKKGMDFWLRDVGLFRDPKLRKPRQEFGYLAPYIYECLLDILYGDKGYYIDYSGDSKDDVLWQLSELTQGRYPATVETLASVVDSLAASGLFSGDLYSRGIITSNRAQRSFFSATLGRAATQVNFDIWLLSEEEMRELNPNGKSFVLQSFISSREKRVSERENHVPQSESTQSRVEQKREDQSRVDESREQQSRESHGVDSDAALIEEIEHLIAGKIDKVFRLEIRRLMNNGMSDKVILQAATKTADKRPDDPPAYLRRILQCYERDGVQTEADLSMCQPVKQRYAPSPSSETTGELAPWEKDWLADVEERRRRREEQEADNATNEE